MANTTSIPESPPVKISDVVMVPIHKLVRHPRNPNTHPEEQLRLLSKIIDYQGWRHAIVVSNLSGFIIQGHARLTVAERNGWPEVPVDYQDYDNEAQEWADLLADNRIAELAELDRPLLKDTLQDLDSGAFDMDLTGYNELAIEGLMTAFIPAELGAELPPPEVVGLDNRNGYYLLVISSDEDRQFWAEKLGLVEPPAGNKTLTVDFVKSGGLDD